MAESGSGCGSSGKRKRPREGCGQKFPGDPPTDATVSLPGRYAGVSTEDLTCAGAKKFRGVTVKVVVEIKKFTGKDRENFYVTLMEAEDVEWRKVIAAIIHDLVRLFWPPKTATALNIGGVELWIRKCEDLPEQRYIGESLLAEFVLARRATLPNAPPEGWKKGLHMTNLGKWIKDQSLVFYQILKDAINKELSQGGRSREEAKQIPAVIEGLETDVDQLNLNEQFTSLKAEHAALEAEHAALEAEHAALKAENKSLKETKEKDDATITSLMALTLSDPPAPDSNLQTETFFYNKIKGLEDALEAKDVELKKARAGYLIDTYPPHSPTTGLMPRHDQVSLQNDD